MKIFVINLRRSNDRREHMTEQLERLGLEYEIFDAIDGQAEPAHHFLAKYDNAARLRWKVRPLSPGEVACFASHYSLWETCARLGEPIVILEDDLLLDETLPDVLQDIGQKIRRLHYVRLGRLFDRKILKLGSAPHGRHYVKYLKPAGGTQGYVIDPAGARRLIRHAHAWTDPVDNYMDHEWVHGLSSLGIEPPCVEHHQVGSSYIGHRDIDRKMVTVPLRIRREIMRNYEKARYVLFNLGFILRYFYLRRAYR